eukprot:CAMPEP_0194557460 /NCGR_PEP_ID=MMETSP0253-20130528/99257_1 /TAXON_ID=2966 /ORGANISM="Noctiluca scintillans" /LENGTH=200 /DNA_ID=CAMNT_0039404963 /DNA_START=45 /DNA_END=644 /DNA_ORIENTATION=+
MQERLSKCEAQVAMRQTTAEQTEKLDSKIESLRTQISDRIAGSFDRIQEVQEDCDKLKRAISWDLERVAAGKVREKKDLAVAKLNKPRGAVMRRSDQTDDGEDVEPEYTKRPASVGEVALGKRPDLDVVGGQGFQRATVGIGSVVSHEMSISKMRTGQRRKPKRSTRWEIHQSVLQGIIRAFSMDEESNIGVAAEKANCY